MKPNSGIIVSAAENGRACGRQAIYGFVRVADYRLYGLDGVNRVASGEWFDAEDDEAAVEAAKNMMDGHDCELWQGSRLVARIAHQDQA